MNIAVAVLFAALAGAVLLLHSVLCALHVLVVDGMRNPVVRADFQQSAWYRYSKVMGAPTRRWFA